MRNKSFFLALLLSINLTIIVKPAHATSSCETRAKSFNTAISTFKDIASKLSKSLTSKLETNEAAVLQELENLRLVYGNAMNNLNNARSLALNFTKDCSCRRITSNTSSVVGQPKSGILTDVDCKTYCESQTRVSKSSEYCMYGNDKISEFKAVK